MSVVLGLIEREFASGVLRSSLLSDQLETKMANIEYLEDLAASGIFSSQGNRHTRAFLVVRRGVSLFEH